MYYTFTLIGFFYEESSRRTCSKVGTRFKYLPTFTEKIIITSIWKSLSTLEERVKIKNCFYKFENFSKKIHWVMISAYFILVNAQEAASK